MKKRLVAIVLIFTMLLGNIQLPVEAASLKLKYNGKTVTYSGKQLKLTVDGKSKSIAKTPGILMTSSGYAMMPYYETFVTSSIKMKKQYVSSTKKLVLTYDSNTLIMTVGKKAATFNGTAVTLPVAPVSVKYINTGVTRILVPSRKVAELFGLSYEWNSSTSTVAISSNSTSVSQTTQTTDSTTPTAYYKGSKSYKLNARNFYYNGTEVELTTTPACVINGYNYVPYYNALVKNGPKIKRKYVSSSKTLTLTNTTGENNNVLVMTLNSTKATLNGKSITLAKAPVRIKFSKAGSYVIYVPIKVISPLLGFEYNYTSSTKNINLIPGLSIKYLGSYTAYTRTQVSINAAGKTVDTDIPGIIEENSTLIPAKSTFNQMYGLGVTYTYKNNTVTVKRGDTTIVTKVNSRIASVNGTSKTMPVATRLITLVSNGYNYAMVPGEFICEELGLNYEYNQGVSYITVPSTSTDGSTSTGSDSSTGTTTPDDSGDDFVATITMLRPTEVAQGTISCADDYRNKRLIVTMTGNQTSFYSTNKPTLPSGVTLTTSYSSATNTTQLIFTTTTINGFRVKEDGSYIYIMNGKPTEIFKNVIVLDAGHGGSDSGAVGSGYYEKDFTLSIVLAAKELFDTNNDYKVYYTRTTDTYPSLSARYKLANEVEADMFISVHINSAGSTATGTETLYNPDRNKVSAAGLSCYQLATITHKHVLAATGLTNRGLKQRCSRLSNGLAVLNNNNGPATLTEIGFISNPTEAKLMYANLSSYGIAVYKAVVDASTTYSTNR